MTGDRHIHSAANRRPPAVSERQFHMLIDGAWTTGIGGRSFSCVDPFTEEEWGCVPEAAAADVDAAVQAARRAFDKRGWSQLPAAGRAALLRRLGQLIATNADRLVRQQIWENGKLISEMGPGIQVLERTCYFYAGLAETLHGATMPPTAPNFMTYTLREPIGVVAAITPWNSPLLLLGWKLFAALAAGNTVVIKPSEITPTSTLILAELAIEAGFPAGVINVVTGHGDPAGSTLVNHPGIDKIAFTGSTSTGAKIGVAAAARHARVSLELGGKSPNIIFSDADLSNAVNGVMAGVFAATGQTCMAGSRVLIESAVYDEVADLLVSRARRMRAGDPLDLSTQLGPLASRAQLAKVLRYFELGESEGLSLLTGGARIDRPGFFVEPTVFGDVKNTCRLAREEIFGPVAALIRFDGEDEATAIANDTPFGLAAGVWTGNVQRAHRMISRLRAGTVWVNNYRMVSYSMPFGGFKQSGIGREMGIEALHEYTEVKSVWIDTGNQIDFAAG
jgi:acyl-CoA reductase-like NAD-dependent aldehyde dehydrogenase